MRAWARCVAVAVAVPALGGLTTAAAQAAAPACGAPARAQAQRGLAALGKGQLTTAASIYAGIRPAGTACAEQGLAAVAALRQARQLIRLGLGPAADAELIQALHAEPALTIPASLLPADLGRPGLTLAEDLDRDGFRQQAAQVLLHVVEHDPGIQLSPADERILGRGGHPWYWWLWHLPWSIVIRPVTWAVAPVVVAVATALFALTRRRLHIQEFTGTNERDADAGAAAILRALVRIELHHLASAATTPDGLPMRLDQAGPYEDSWDLDPVADGLPSALKPLVRAIGMVMSQLEPRARLVTGSLLPQARLAVGIETAHGGVVEAGLISCEDLQFPDQKGAGLAHLALPAAAWIILAAYPGCTLGGTQHWRSYAHFAAGCAWQARGDLDKARKLYEKACADPRNTAAAVNLAALERLRERQQPGYPAVLVTPSYARLSGVVQATQRRPGAAAGRGAGDPQYHRARYLLSTYLRDSVDAEPDPFAASPERDRISAEARRYAVELALGLERDHGRLPADFVRRGRPAALALVARQAFPASSGPADQLAQPRDPADTAVTDTDIRDILENLQEHSGEPGQGGSQRGTPERIVQFVSEQLAGDIDDEAHYNLAQYHAARARLLGQARQSWERRAEDARSAAAAADPHGTRADELRSWEEDVLLWQDLLADDLLDEEDLRRESAALAASSPNRVLRDAVERMPPLEPEFAAAAQEAAARDRAGRGSAERERAGREPAGREPAGREPADRGPGTADWVPGAPRTAEAAGTRSSARRRRARQSAEQARYLEEPVPDAAADELDDSPVARLLREGGPPPLPGFLADQPLYPPAPPDREPGDFGGYRGGSDYPGGSGYSGGGGGYPYPSVYPGGSGQQPDDDRR